jgi:hypothetical protein
MGQYSLILAFTRVFENKRFSSAASLSVNVFCFPFRDIIESFLTHRRKLGEKIRYIRFLHNGKKHIFGPVEKHKTDQITSKGLFEKHKTDQMTSKGLSWEERKDLWDNIKSLSKWSIGTCLLGTGLTWLAFRYHVAQPTEMIAVTGIGIKGVKVRKTALQLPFQKASAFPITPKTFNLTLKSMMSKEMLGKRFYLLLI